MTWREETDEERADREAEWNAVYVRCRTCHFGSIETEFGEDQCPDCSSTLFVPVDGPVYQPTFGIPDDGSTETAEAYDAWLEFDALVKAGWVVEVGEDSTP